MNMPSFRICLPLAAALAGSLLTPLAARAQESSAAPARLAPISVASPSLQPAPRHDVKTVCPLFKTSLTESLQRRVGYVGQRSEMLVNFRVDGQTVTDVVTRGGDFAHRPLVRRAVRQLECQADGQSNQSYAFLVVFKPADDSTSDEAPMALLPPGAVASAD